MEADREEENYIDRNEGMEKSSPFALQLLKVVC